MTISRGAVDSTGFEAGEGFPPASDVAKSPAWSMSDPGAGRLTATNAQTGQQSLEVLPSTADRAARTEFSIPKGGIVFLDFAVLPSAEDASEPVYVIDANGARLGFLKKADQNEGIVVAVSPSVEPTTKSNSTDSGFSFPLEEEGKSAVGWIRVTVRQDLAARTWDLFLDGKLALVDQPLASPSEKGKATVAFFSLPAGSTFVDDLSIGDANPLFPDADRDGIPDAVEILNGSNPYFDDRRVDANQDGHSNVENWLEGKSFGFARRNSRRVIFVDNRAGSDAFAGGLSYRAAADGPKATLKAAIQSAAGDEMIALLPSSQPYTLVERAKGSAHTINLIPLGEISLRTPDNHEK